MTTASERTIVGRCPRCCPDGGAVFDRWGVNLDQKKCRNCGDVLPLRRIQPTGKPTPSQARILARIVAVFGGKPEVEMIGRKLWFSLQNPERDWMLGDSCYGTIGPTGAFKVTLQRFGGYVTITDTIGVDVYLK